MLRVRVWPNLFSSKNRSLLSGIQLAPSCGVWTVIIVSVEADSSKYTAGAANCPAGCPSKSTACLLWNADLRDSDEIRNILTSRVPDGDLSLADTADHCAFRGGQQHLKHLRSLLKVILNYLSLPAPLGHSYTGRIIRRSQGIKNRQMFSQDL